jgi:hypothetical protein
LLAEQHGAVSEPYPAASVTAAGLSAYVRLTGPNASINFDGTTLGGAGVQYLDVVLTCIAFSVKDSVL